MKGEERKHVVQKPDAGVHIGLAAAAYDELSCYVGFLGLAFYRRTSYLYCQSIPLAFSYQSSGFNSSLKSRLHRIHMRLQARYFRYPLERLADLLKRLLCIRDYVRALVKIRNSKAGEKPRAPPSRQDVAPARNLIAHANSRKRNQEQHG